MNNQETFSKSFVLAENMLEKYWDMWLVSLGSMSWSQEQFENMVKKYLDTRKMAREEATEVIEELMQQVKKNQMQIQSMIREAVQDAFENTEVSSFSYFEDLKKKLDELMKKVQDL